MKFLKTFEDRKHVNYERDIKYKYLNEEDNIKIKEFINNFFDKLNIFELIKKLKYTYFVDNDFNYHNIFDSLLTFVSNINIEVDLYCRKNNIHADTSSLRNSMYNIINNFYNSIKKDFKNKLDEQLIKELQDKPEKYKTRYQQYGDKFSKKVKNECEYILTAKNFNL